VNLAEVDVWHVYHFHQLVEPFRKPVAIFRAYVCHRQGGGDVMLFADGAGSSSFKGTMENTNVFSLVKAAAGY
jgi:alkaline phosphatase